MDTDLKISVMGLGGVGGLLSGALIRHYGNSVSLIARGKRAEHLRSQGLTIHSEVYGEFTVKPGLVTDDPAQLPVQDIVLVCVKNGGLEQAAAQLKPIVGPRTLVLPVMNGVSASRNLRAWLGQGHVLDSVIYTVSSAGPDYSITQKGPFTTIHMGASLPEDREGARACCAALKEAGIDCRLAEDVQVAIWSKYVLNCAYNVVTARWGINIGQIKADPKLTQEYRQLMEEAWQVGRAAAVALPADLLEKHMDRLAHTTDDSTSSLSRDFDEGRTGEMDIFCGEVIRMAQQLGIEVPVTQAYQQGLQERAAAFGR